MRIEFSAAKRTPLQGHNRKLFQRRPNRISGHFERSVNIPKRIASMMSLGRWKVELTKFATKSFRDHDDAAQCRTNMMPSL
ncbi:MAG: hypothetical protein DMF33_03150 [Verrucomicrobia bacterium]|nr:MAG: hypothetical protein DMF33_03150 [Verrucomicrobiota bacterium]